MAGEIYIADKITLDAVNTKVGTASDTGGTTSAGTVMAKLNKNIADAASMAGIMTSTRGGYIDNINTKVNTLAANNDRKGFTAADLITNKKYVLNTVALPAATSSQNILTINGSGYLYLAVASYSGDEYNTNVIDFTITVDNIVICKKQISSPTETGTTGLITPNGLIRSDGGGFYMSPSGNTNFNFTNNRVIMAPSSSTNTSQAFVYLPKPVRFTSSFKLEGRISGSYDQYCSFMYELD